MAKMTARTTFAFGEATMGDIRKMAGSLGVSQAEIVRRSVRLLVEYNEKPVITAADVIEHYRANPAILADIESGVPVSVSAIVWFEFATGTVTTQELVSYNQLDFAPFLDFGLEPV